MNEKQRHYHSFLLRLWRPEGDSPAPWLASLEDHRTGLRIGFANLGLLYAFLLEQTGETAGEARSGQKADSGNSL